MGIVTKIIVGTAAISAALGSVALAGMNYEAGPTVGDNGALAGIILLLAIGVIIMMKGNAAPPPADDDDKPAEEE